MGTLLLSSDTDVDIFVVEGETGTYTDEMEQWFVGAFTSEELAIDAMRKDKKEKSYAPKSLKIWYGIRKFTLNGGEDKEYKPPKL